ncbi:Hypothetical protein SMAX5B_012459 [Scophthalmus maximus]|uniref:Uncharacterized protein n=1 Tax=Scophthalmus maximus TaxID=52904 RepID=A0A2U9B763_SCOMX|nr:Hypothetical protein SMAX5B_012459 [Scophthalmus maximus]KAF0038660.1 hypothetical protein F2P81_009144 [Scophthalmus maximus]
MNQCRLRTGQFVGAMMSSREQRPEPSLENKICKLPTNRLKTGQDNGHTRKNERAIRESLLPLVRLRAIADGEELDPNDERKERRCR